MRQFFQDQSTEVFYLGVFSVDQLAVLNFLKDIKHSSKKGKLKISGWFEVDGKRYKVVARLRFQHAYNALRVYNYRVTQPFYGFAVSFPNFYQGGVLWNDFLKFAYPAIAEYEQSLLATNGTIDMSVDLDALLSPQYHSELKRDGSIVGNPHVKRLKAPRRNKTTQIKPLGEVLGVHEQSDEE